MAFLAELKRRNVLRVAAAYIAVSWLLIQVVETLFPVFDLSDAAIRAVVIVLVIGFVPVLIVAWAFELTHEGIVREEDVDHNSPQFKAAARRLDRLIMVALAVAIGYFALDKFMLDPARDEAREQVVAETAREEGRAEAASRRRVAGPPVIAVLPFSAVTATEESEFFAAGVHDDLLTRLAHLSSMLVISRSSVLEYKDVQRNIREIGEELGADAVLEGGVQSAGGRIRINAQLIDAKTDEHLWAETYDRELSADSIFDVQDDIAAAIAAALDVATREQEADDPFPTQNMAAYRAWHEAMALRGAGLSGLDFADYRALLQKAIDLDPTFTRPLAELLGNYALAVWYNKNPEVIAMVEDLLEQIRDLAPGSVDFLIAQTFYTYYVLNDYDLAHQIVTRALERAPSDTELMRIKSWIERRRGDYDAYIETLRLARKLDPRQPAYTAGIARALFLHHRYAEAKNELDVYGARSYDARRLLALLQFREHGDLGRLAADIETAIEGNRDMMAIVDLWWFRFINRDFEGAAEANKMLPGNGYFDLQSEVVLSPRGFSRLSDIAFFGKEAGDDEFLAEVKATITEHSTEEQRNGGGATFAMAMVAAAEGNVDNMRKHIHDWHGGRGSDWTERTLNLDFTCQLFGVVGDAQSAVACIRDGLEGPSMVVPWFETLNPYYDPIRETPEFMELVEELNRETSTRR